MILIIGYSLLLLVFLYNIKTTKSGLAKADNSNGIYFSDYLSIEKTNSIKGLFILLILMSHSSINIESDNALFNIVREYAASYLLGTNIVSMFFLYSGWAIMFSIKNKGSNYLKSIPTKRVLRVLLNYDIAVVLIFAVSYVLGNSYSFKDIVFAVIPWVSIPNYGYGWYIFVILVLYLMSYILFTIFKGSDKKAIAAMFILTIVFSMALLVLKHHAGWWYQTNLLFPIGMLYYMYEEQIVKLFKKKQNVYYVLLIASLIATIILSMVNKYLGDKEALIFGAIRSACGVTRTITFGAFVLLLTMKVQIHNKILSFYGKHLMAILMLQIIPMLVLDHFGLNQYHYAWIYFVVVIVVTTALCVPFDIVTKRINEKLFASKKQN